MDQHAADTAFVIARVRAEEAELPPGEQLFEDPYARIFRPTPEAEGGVERFLAMPFVREYVRLRTRFIDDFLREAVREGVRQVVLLGVGFDCRALRMAELSGEGIAVFEVDQAGQLARREASLAEAGVTQPGRARSVPFDFREVDFAPRLEAELARVGFRVGNAAVFVWEGVVPYIDDAAVARSLAFMARAAGPGTRVVLDYHALRFAEQDFASRAREAGFASWEEFGMDGLFRKHVGREPPDGAGAFRVAIART